MTEQAHAHNEVTHRNTCCKDHLKAVRVPFDDKLPYNKHKSFLFFFLLFPSFFSFQTRAPGLLNSRKLGVKRWLLLMIFFPILPLIRCNHRRCSKIVTVMSWPPRLLLGTHNSLPVSLQNSVLCSRSFPCRCCRASVAMLLFRCIAILHANVVIVALMSPCRCRPTIVPRLIVLMVPLQSRALAKGCG